MRKMKFQPKQIRYNLTVPPAGGEGNSVMAFSLAKAGSTLLYNILRALSPSAGLTYFSVEDQLFSNNVSPTRRPTRVGNIFSPTGYCYGGFRQFPAYRIQILHSARTILLVRDPRDMITSLYFSVLKSHYVPKSDANDGAKKEILAARAQLQHTDISDYAVDAIRNYIKMFEGYVAQGFHWRQNVAVYRYEDVIFKKAEWIADMCEWYGWNPPQEIVQSVLQSVDVMTEDERPEEHIRQVAPGNHVKHLKPATIRTIERTLGEYMRLFGYLYD
jgi:hypothetical protein